MAFPMSIMIVTHLALLPIAASASFAEEHGLEDVDTDFLKPPSKKPSASRSDISLTFGEDEIIRPLPIFDTWARYPDVEEKCDEIPKRYETKDVYDGDLTTGFNYYELIKLLRKHQLNTKTPLASVGKAQEVYAFFESEIDENGKLSHFDSGLYDEFLRDCMFPHEIFADSTIQDLFSEMRKVYAVEKEIKQTYFRHNWSNLDKPAGSDNQGNSGSTIWFSADKKYILKTMVKDDVKGLLKMLPSYVAYNKQTNGKTLLPRIFDVVDVDGKAAVIMNNWAADINDIVEDSSYDLKGSMYQRRGKKNGKKSHKDIRFFMNYKLLNKWEPECQGMITEIMLLIKKDVEFLRSGGFMDYSLCVWPVLEKGKSNASTPMAKSLQQSLAPSVLFTDENGVRMRLYFGLVDILQLFEGSKMIESVAKAGCTEASAKRPNRYASRFMALMGYVFNPSQFHTDLELRLGNNGGKISTLSNINKLDGACVSKKCHAWTRDYMHAFDKHKYVMNLEWKSLELAGEDRLVKGVTDKIISEFKEGEPETSTKRMKQLLRQLRRT